MIVFSKDISQNCKNLGLVEQYNTIISSIVVFWVRDLAENLFSEKLEAEEIIRASDLRANYHIIHMHC